MNTTAVVVGGGWAGCSSALAARNAGAEHVIILERSDELLGTGLVGGIMRNNGRFTAAEEMIAMGAGALFEVCDTHARHRNFDFPGHRHASLYDVNTISSAVQEQLLAAGVEIWLMSRVTEVEQDQGLIEAVTLENGYRISGDVFIDATGTVGSQSFCTETGNGCVMCVMRCPTFGPRVSLTGLAGVQETIGRRSSGTIGAMSGSCKLNKDTLAPRLVAELDARGMVMVPLADHLIDESKLASKACQQYALGPYATNVIVLDTGQAKLMTSYMPLHELRQIPGFEHARYEDPYAGTVGNSMRYAAMSPRDDTMRVSGGPRNLFCSGEKAGLLVGHTEAMVTGSLAGHNAARWMAGRELLELPTSLAVGDAISHVRQAMVTAGGMDHKYTFSGSVYFERMQERGLYTTDVDQIGDRVENAGLTGVMTSRVVV